MNGGIAQESFLAAQSTVFLAPPLRVDQRVSQCAR